MTRLYQFTLPNTGERAPMISKETYDIVMKNADVGYLHSIYYTISAFKLCNSLQSRFFLYLFRVQNIGAFISS